VAVHGQAALAAISLPPVISSHMVLQRGMPAPIWGMGQSGERVLVRFRGQEKTAQADVQGRWMVKLDPLDVGEAADMTIEGSSTITLTDVVVGEVWMGSGQSNMDTSVLTYVTDTMPAGAPGAVMKPEELEAAGDAVSAHHFRDGVLAELAQGSYPQLRLISSREKTGWKVATPANIGQFSALLFVYGQSLQKDLKVPVGVMFGAVGATSSEQWISQEAYKADAACKEALASFSATYSFEAEQNAYEKALADWDKASAATTRPGAKPPAALPPKPRPPFHVGDVTRDLARPNTNIGDLYELHVRPYIPYAIRGVLWDQGEGGTGIFGLDQYYLMGALIRGWRKDWGQGDFPFLYVQKPSGRGCAWDPQDPITRLASPFAALPERIPDPRGGLGRESYTRITEYPNTFMVTSSDLGTGTHPVNKSGYGTRAARVALGAVYGKKVEYYGPVYDSFATEGSTVRVRFTHVGQGLAFRHGEKLQGFMIAGEDKVFQWADAVIDGDTVAVSSPQVPKPAAVRYAWSNRHPWANLFNKDGLPAQAFRTDTW
jgi:sialate O-acetylesterase